MRNDAYGRDRKLAAQRAHNALTTTFEPDS
jgi:hypothetical protein